MIILLIVLLMAFASAASGAGMAAGLAETNAGNANSNPKAQQPDQSALQRLLEVTGGRLQVREDPATGVVGFLRITDGPGLALAPQSASGSVQADAFLQEYGSIFGITDSAAELVVADAATDSLGMGRVAYQQIYQGVEVFAATLLVHTNAANQVTAVNGVYVPGIDLNVVPTLGADAAAARALAVVAEANPGATGLSVGANKLYVYRDGLIQGVRGPNYLVYEVEVTNGSSVRDFVYVDAHAGKVVNRISAVQDGLHRELYEQSFTPANLVWEEGDAFPGALNVDQANIVDFSGDSYNFFFNAFDWDSYDNGGAFMRSVNNDPTIACPNANWNGATTNYCNGVTSDDIVAHEWGHAYTQYTSDLIYQW